MDFPLREDIYWVHDRNYDSIGATVLGESTAHRQSSIDTANGSIDDTRNTTELLQALLSILLCDEGLSRVGICTSTLRSS